MNKFLVHNPIISEKMTSLAAERKYAFLVEKDITSSEVKKAVEGVYKVNVLKTNVINIPGKLKQFRGRVFSKSGHKKVIVTLKKGQKLDILPG